MKTKETKPTTIVELDKIDPLTLPELASFKEKSLAVVKENPYIEIVDNPTYELAKKARTNLRSNRTELQKQEKAIKDKLNGFKKKVENVTAELIAITEPYEIKQQAEVTRYEDIKEQERLEKARIEQERVDGIKAKIKSFADLFNSKIQSLTFEGIADFKTEFEEFVKVQPKEVFEEFEVLYSDMLESVETFFHSKVLMLTEQENNRLEQVRLTEERLENERKLNIRNGIQSWFNNWSAIIDTLSFFNHKDVFNEFLNEGTANYQEFQEEYASNRKVLVSKFENKIKFLNEVEDNRIASEKLDKEKADFEAKQLETKYQERKKFLVDEDYWNIYFQAECFERESTAKLNLLLFTDEGFEDFKKAVLKAKEPVIEEEVVFSAPESLSSHPDNGILFKEIEVVEPVVVDEEIDYKSKSSVLLIDEITKTSEMMKDCLNQKVSPSYIIKQLIIKLRKLDHLHENELGFLDSFIFNDFKPKNNE